MRKSYFFNSLFTLFFLSSTFVLAQVPQGYYSSAEGLNGETLKQALHDIIDNHIEFPYTSSSTDTWDILKEADKDPDNPQNVIGVYSAFSMNAEAEYNNGNGWNREHVWAKSRGDFGTSPGPGTDAHHLRAADISTNSARNNRNFDEAPNQYDDASGQYSGMTNSYTSSLDCVWEPREEVKGDIARMIFYMAVRYEGDASGEPDLELVEEYLSAGSKEPYHAKLSTLLQWHKADPVNDAERRRNDVVYSFQKNRNPFIDHPEFVLQIWEYVTATVDKIVEQNIYIFPNPVGSTVQVHLKDTNAVKIISSNGSIVLTCPSGCNDIMTDTLTNLNQGVYYLFVFSEKGVNAEKFVKQ